MSSLGKPAPSLKGQFGPKGALFSGWETRRHNPSYDWLADFPNVKGVCSILCLYYQVHHTAWDYRFYFWLRSRYRPFQRFVQVITGVHDSHNDPLPLLQVTRPQKSLLMRCTPLTRRLRRMIPEYVPLANVAILCYSQSTVVADPAQSRFRTKLETFIQNSAFIASELCQAEYVS